MSDLEVVTVGGRADEPLLDAFHAGIYLDAFAHQREPVEVWKRRLWDAAPPYELTVRIARDRGAIAGGIAFERYRRSGCGLMTYLVVGEAWRGRGLGRRLLDGAIATLRDAGAPYVLGEVHGAERLARFQRWGARVLDFPYVQPALGPGLARDADLRLVAFGTDGASARGDVIRAFVTELYEITEGGTPALDVPDRVPLVTV